MAIYTVKVERVCSGGGHVSIAVYRDGAHMRSIVVTREDLLDATVDFESLLAVLLRLAIRASGATTLAQAKAAVESAQWVI